MIPGRANVIIDGQWGSTGKGKLAAYLSLRHGVDVAMANHGPNAGHTHYEGERKVVLHHLPSSLANPKTKLLIGPCAIINVKNLLQEIKDNGVAERLWIDPHALVVEERDAIFERVDLKNISSTMQGTGRAMMRKINREARLAERVPELWQWIEDTGLMVHDSLRGEKKVLIETPQGFDLSLSHGCLYPHVTGREITPSTALGECGIPPQLVGDIYGSLRTFPIRVGHQYNEKGKKVGDSGPCHMDQKEISWAEVGAMAGYPADTINEVTTVTGKRRRVFTWSRIQFAKFLMYCAPTKLFLNFVNYLSAGDVGVHSFPSLGKKSRDWVEQTVIYSPPNPAGPLTGLLIGTGPKHEDMIEADWRGEVVNNA